MSRAKAVIRTSLANALELAEAQVDELGRLDALAGDGDHGTTVVRGLRAANETVASSTSAAAGQCLVQAGSAFSDAAGGAAGALYGMFLATVGTQLGAGPFGAANVAKALRAGYETVARLGKAQPGDKTLLDTLSPFLDALDEQVAAGATMIAAWSAALPAAEVGAERTREMVARRGRSARLGERSLGHRDPGAVSMHIMLRAVGDALDAQEPAAWPGAPAE